ncbi:MAG: hypothetical protein IJA15_05735 [Clostridia bacterium]|nr:hypothetical protein [Clostridia bacterium]
MEREKIYEKIQKALLKRALGYDSSETVEEYAKDGEDMTIIRKKVTKKNVPPDISAVKMLLENLSDSPNSLSSLSEEELEKEKLRLLALLKEKCKVENS